MHYISAGYFSTENRTSELLCWMFSRPDISQQQGVMTIEYCSKENFSLPLLLPFFALRNPHG